MQEQSRNEFNIRPSSQPQQDDSMPGHEALANNLATSLARTVRSAATFIVNDKATNEIFIVTVNRLPDDPESKVTYMRAGLPGETCDCCEGSGVKKGT